MNQFIKKILIVLLICVILIVLFFGTYFLIKRTNKEKNINKEEIESSIKQNDFSSGCENIEDEYQKNICWENEAIQKKDIEICKNINIENYLGSCENNVITEVFKTEKNTNISFCSQINSEIYLPYCFFSIAKQKNYKIEECSKLEEKLKKICEESFFLESAISEKNVSLCSEIKTDETKQICLSSLIAEEDDINFCNNLDEQDKINCMENIIFRLAIEKKDIEACKKIDSEDLKNYCINFIQYSQDIDRDNLKNEDEEKYGTDPNNPDSDGDGFLDGDEVENGYDPMGEGKLAS